MRSITFSCNDVAVKINSDDENITKYLIEMFGNYYEINSNVMPTIVINYKIGVPSEFQYKDKEQNDNSYNYISGNENEININIPYYDETKQSFIKRVFTTSSVKAFQKENYMILHGACTFKDNDGIIITGVAGSGKTTLLQKLLNNGYGYVANDRLALKEEDNGIVVCGIPFSMGIRNVDIQKDFSDCSSYYIKEIDKKFLENKDVSKYFEIEMKSEIPLSTIIFCNYDTNIDGLRVEPINDINKRIFPNIMFDDAIPDSKYYLHSIFGNYKNKCDLSKVKSIEMIQGLNSEKETIKEIEKSRVRKRGN